jgi:hypothetical protein
LQLVVTPEGLKRTKEEKPAVLRVEKPRVSPYSRSLLVQRPTKPVEKKVVIVVGAKETEVSIEGTEDIDANGQDVRMETVESMKTAELECHEEIVDGKDGMEITDIAEGGTSSKEEAEVIIPVLFYSHPVPLFYSCTVPLSYSQSVPPFYFHNVPLFYPCTAHLFYPHLFPCSVPVYCLDCSSLLDREL